MGKHPVFSIKLFKEFETDKIFRASSKDSDEDSGKSSFYSIDELIKNYEENNLSKKVFYICIDENNSKTDLSTQNYI